MTIKPKNPRGTANKVSAIEYDRLLKLASFRHHAKRDTLMILFSYGLGLRAKEIAHLKIGDVIDDKGNIIAQVKLTKTKGNEPRKTFLEHEDITKALNEYLDYRKAWCERTGNIFSLNQPLFLSQKGSQFDDLSVVKLFKVMYIKAGINATSHSGRVTFATNLIERGVDIKSLQVLLGHSNIHTTMKYVKENPDRLKKVILNALY